MTTSTEALTESLTENQWQTAHAIAQTLVKQGADVNELGKAIAYLRTFANQELAGSKFFNYLKTLVNHGDRVGHSQQTKAYYTSIERTCKQHLQSYQNDASAMLQILGWSARLMYYYKTQPVEELPTSSFAVGQVLEAKVTKIKGKEVSYEMLATIRLTVKEPKKHEILKEGQMVKVEITDLREDGSIRKVKLLTQAD